MNKLSTNDLWSLENYSKKRPEYRKEIMAHKKHRQLVLGENVRVLFEDRKTIHYQVQEMLRIEKLFEAEEIQQELDAYNPLIPDGSNWKATMMIEYTDVEERKQRLAELIGIETLAWLQVDEFDKIHPIADEDMPRDSEEKTSSVHFLRFELSDAMVKALKNGALMSAGIDHANYTISGERLDSKLHESLVDDLD